MSLRAPAICRALLPRGFFAAHSRCTTETPTPTLPRLRGRERVGEAGRPHEVAAAADPGAAALAMGDSTLSHSRQGKAVN
jgi:hypothetical protein